MAFSSHLKLASANSLSLEESKISCWGKGYEQFLLFPQCFQKTCTADTLRPRHVWEMVNPFPHNNTFWRPWEFSLLKTLGKGEIARNEQFLLFPKCFLPVWTTVFHFHQIWNCCLQTPSVLKSLKFVVWEWVKKLKKYIYKPGRPIRLELLPKQQNFRLV